MATSSSSSDEDFSDEEFDLEALLRARPFLSEDESDKEKDYTADENKDLIAFDLIPVSSITEINREPLDSIQNLAEELETSFIDPVTPVQNEQFVVNQLSGSYANAVRRRIMARRRLTLNNNPDEGEYTFAKNYAKHLKSVCQRTDNVESPTLTNPEMSAQTPYNQLLNKRKGPNIKRRTPVQVNWNRRMPHFSSVEGSQATEEREIVHSSLACETIVLLQSDDSE